MLTVNEELAIDFYVLSERYMIDELKEECGNYLKDILTLDNCFKIFEVAYLYDVAFLKQKILLLFRENLEEITKRKDFENIPKLSYIEIKRMQLDEQKITF